MAGPERRENLGRVETKLTGASPKSSARVLTEEEDTLLWYDSSAFDVSCLVRGFPPTCVKLGIKKFESGARRELAVY